MKIVLYQPQIPQNTGNIVRTCSVTGAELVLIGPLGFSTSDRMLKRAGLDYWHDVPIVETDDFDTFLEKEASKPIYFLSSHAKRYYTDVPMCKDTILVFGSETSGLPSFYTEKYAEQCCTIPMLPGQRCLNLSNAVSIVLYEGLRQQNFIF